MPARFRMGRESPTVVHSGPSCAGPRYGPRALVSAGVGQRNPNVADPQVSASCGSAHAS